MSTRYEVRPPANRTRRSVLQGAAAWGLLGFWSLPAPRAQANDVHVGQAAPAATLLTLDGKRLSTPELIGQVVILTFWATWCVPCREELPLLSKYAAEHAEVFHLWWHPEDLAAHVDQNLRILRSLLQTFAEYRARYEMVSLSMAELVEPFRRLASTT